MGEAVTQRVRVLQWEAEGSWFKPWKMDRKDGRCAGCQYTFQTPAEVPLSKVQNPPKCNELVTHPGVEPASPICS